MPTAPVDSNGTELFFTDTGPVEGSDDYTTLVVLHGCGFTGASFNKLLPYSTTSNTRLVLVNRRPYRGSSPYTDRELEDLKTGNPAWLQRIAKELANFLVWFINTQNVPPPSEDGRTGGVCVMAWSLGNTSVLTLLAYPEVLSPYVSSRLETYLRKIILYGAHLAYSRWDYVDMTLDPPHCVFGYDKPKGSYDPFEDPEFAGNEAAASEQFLLWATAYYDHEGLATGRISDLNFEKLGRDPGINTVSAEELGEITDSQAAAQSDVGMIYWLQEACKVQTHRAIFDEYTVRRVFPKVGIAYVYGTNSFWTSVMALMELEKAFRERSRAGRTRRVEFMQMEGASHFAHWDDPKWFWNTIVEATSSPSGLHRL